MDLLPFKENKNNENIKNKIKKKKMRNIETEVDCYDSFTWKIYYKTLYHIIYNTIYCSKSDTIRCNRINTVSAVSTSSGLHVHYHLH